MAEAEAKHGKGFYSVVAIALVVCISLSVFVFLQVNANRSAKTQLPSVNPQTTSPPISNLPQPTALDTSFSPTYPLTEAEALRIASPIINQYARENNRVVTGFTEEFYNVSSGSGGVWNVLAKFSRSGFTFNDSQYWIVGYQVGVWADTGKIDYQQVYGIM